MLIDHAGDRIGQNDSRVGQQAAPVAGMVCAFAQVYRQLEVEHSARAEKQGRVCRRQARAIGGNENVGGEFFCVRLAERAQAR